MFVNKYLRYNNSYERRNQNHMTASGISFIFHVQHVQWLIATLTDIQGLVQFLSKGTTYITLSVTQAIINLTLVLVQRIKIAGNNSLSGVLMMKLICWPCRSVESDIQVSNVGLFTPCCFRQYTESFVTDLFV